MEIPPAPLIVRKLLTVVSPPPTVVFCTTVLVPVSPATPAAALLLLLLPRVRPTPSPTPSASATTRIAMKRSIHAVRRYHSPYFVPPEDVVRPEVRDRSGAEPREPAGAVLAAAKAERWED